jgi:hypothetical protein
MKNMIVAIIVMCMALSGCRGRTTSPSAARGVVVPSSSTKPDYRNNFTAPEFSKAIVGCWTSVFTYPFSSNIREAEFRSDGKAVVSVISSNTNEEVAGAYRVEFPHEPDQGMITVARIVIHSGGRDFVLAGVNFGHHNGVMWDAGSGPFLRIDKEPYGVLKRVSQQPPERDSVPAAR